METTVFLKGLVLFIFCCQNLSYGSILQIPWVETIATDVYDLAVKITLFESHDYFSNPHDRGLYNGSSLKVENVLYCFLDANDLISLPSQPVDQNRLFTGLEDYLLLTRLYYANSEEENRLIFQFPDGKFPLNLIYSLQNELLTWKLVLIRLEDLHQHNFPTAEIQTCRSCLHSYRLISENILSLLESIKLKHAQVCNAWFLYHPEGTGGDYSMIKQHQEFIFREFQVYLDHYYSISDNLSNGKKEMIHHYLVQYWENSLKPFLSSSVLCLDHQPHVILYESLPPSSNEIRNHSTLVVLNQCSTLPANKKNEVLDLQRNAKLRQLSTERFELNSYEWCLRKVVEVTSTTLLQLNTVGDIQSTHSPSLDYQFDIGSNQPGQRTLLQQFLYCPTYDRHSPNQCSLAFSLQLSLNQMIFQGLLLVSPQPFLLSIPLHGKKLKSIYSIGRILSFGTSFISLLHYFQIYFPRFQLELVEPSFPLIEIMSRFFNLDLFLCHHWKVQNVNHSSIPSSGVYSVSMNNSCTAQSLKRISLVEASFADYLQWIDTYIQIVEKGEEQPLERLLPGSNEYNYLTKVATIRPPIYPYFLSADRIEGIVDIYFDYILLDLADEYTLLLQQIKKLLRPFTGVAIFSLERQLLEIDKIMESLVHNFGEKQLVVFDVSVDQRLVMAVRDRYHDEENEESNVYYRSHPLYRHESHPCDVNRPLPQIEPLLNKLKLEAYLSSFYKYSLNCQWQTKIHS